MKYPWHDKQWHQFWQSVQAKRLPHALLLTGMAGTGKLSFALHAAQALLCQQVSSDGTPCDHCHACRLVMTHAHPNVYQVLPETEGHAIKVDQIRALSEFVQQSSLQGEFRVAVIYPAHNMNMNAANALLKTLEEPAEGAILILVTDQPNHLPATIRSRCQQILFAQPETKLSLQWLRSQAPGMQDPEQALRLAHGAPLLALKLNQEDLLPLRADVFQSLQQLVEKRVSPLTLAAKWQKVDPVQWLDLLSGWVIDLVRIQSGAHTHQLLNQDYQNVLNLCSQRIPMANNLRLMENLLAARGQMSAGINLNKQLLMERLLLRWLEPRT